MDELSGGESAPQRIFAPGGREVRRSPDAQNRLCANCHAANAEGVAGSSDDRTPLGEQEGMSCTDCHKGHDMKADPSRGRCPHPQSASRRKRKRQALVESEPKSERVIAGSLNK